MELYLRLNAKTVLSVNIKHKKMMLQKGGTESCQIIKLKKRGWITNMVVQWNDSKHAWWPRVKPRNIVLIMMKNKQVFLHQGHYVEKMLEKFGQTEAKLVSTPADLNFKLQK